VEELKPEQTAPLINIIIRTHNRPGYLKKCLESVQAQNYDNLFIIVIADNPESTKYAQPYLDEGMIDDLVSVVPANFKSSDFSELKKQGLCKSDSDKDKHFYDLYLNQVIKDIEEGYILILDDDKELASENSLKNLSKKLDENSLVIVQHALQKRTVPGNDKWKQLPFVRAHVDMACMIFHSDHKELVKFDGHGAGDWRVANKLAENLEPVWYKTVLTSADNNGNSGKPENKIKK